MMSAFTPASFGTLAAVGGHLGADLWRVATRSGMETHVCRDVDKLQVLGSVVRRIMIQMMNVLFRTEAAAELLRHDQPMLRHVSVPVAHRMPTSKDHDISAAHVTSAFPRVMFCAAFAGSVPVHISHWITGEVAVTSGAYLGDLGGLTATAPTDTGRDFVRFRNKFSAHAGSIAHIVKES